MKKRILSALLCLMMLVTLLPAPVWADTTYSGTCGDNATWTYDRDTYTLTISGTGEVTSSPWRSELPSTTKSYLYSVVVQSGITSLCNYAFSGLSCVYKVSLPDTLTAIPNGAFSGCFSIMSGSITLPNSITSIGNTAFFRCKYLTGITLPNRLTTIGDEAFYECKNLTGVTFPSTLTTIGKEAFYECDALTAVTFPDGLTTIGKQAFRGCYNLTIGIIPASVTSIGTAAFVDCNNLTAFSVDRDNPCYCNDSSGVLFNKDKTTLMAFPSASTKTKYTIPSGVTSIDDYAFYDCQNLTSVTIPSGVRSIGISAFYFCSSLTSVSLGAGLTSIPSGMFHSCTKLTEITIPDGVTTIGTQAFYDCWNLTTATIPSSVVSIESQAFYSEYAMYLTDVYFGGTEKQWNAIEIDSKNNGLLDKSTIHFGKTVDPTVLSIDNVAETGAIKLTWEAVDSAVSYVVWRGLGDSYYTRLCTVNGGTSFVDNNVTPGRTYYYFVDAVNEASETSEGSNIVSLAAACARPTLSAADKSPSGGVQLKWEAVDGAATYLVYRGSGRRFLRYGATTDTSFSDLNTTPGTSYSYRVKALTENEVESAPSETVTCIAICAAPVLNLSTDANGDVLLTWEAVPGATGYDLYFSEDGKSFTHYDSTVDTDYTDKQLSPGDTCYYKLVATCSDTSLADSAFSNVVSCTVAPAAPAVSISTVTSTGRIKLTWSAVDGAAKYYIYRSTDGGKTYKYYDSTTKTSYTNTSVTPGTKYYYKLKSVSATGEKSAYSNAVYRTADCAKPSLSSSIVTSSGAIKLTWGSVTGASKYYIYRSTDGGTTYKYYTSTTSTSWTNKSVTPGTKYYYKIKAICSNSEGNSAYSNVVYRTADCAKPSLSSSIVSSSGAIKLSWSKVTGATKYYIYRSTDGGTTYKYYTSTTSTSWTNKSVTPGTKYYYKIKAICSNTEGNSAYSNVVYRTADCAKPSLSSSIVTSSGAIKLTWGSVTGASKYYIYRSTDGGTTYKYYTSTTSTSWTNKSVTPGTKYYYKIKAICSNTEGNSAYSNVVYRTADCAKPVVTIQLSGGKPQLKWKAIDGASKYYIYRSTDGGKTYSCFTTVTATSWTNKSAKSGTTYYYKVKAVCAKSSYGNSAYSNIVSIKSK